MENALTSNTKVVNNTVVTITKRKLTKYEFCCKKCNTIHTKPPYAIAQKAMGHKLIFTCDCGNKIKI